MPNQLRQHSIRLEPQRSLVLSLLKVMFLLNFIFVFCILIIATSSLKVHETQYLKLNFYIRGRQLKITSIKVPIAGVHLLHQNKFIMHRPVTTNICNNMRVHSYLRFIMRELLCELKLRRNGCRTHS